MLALFLGALAGAAPYYDNTAVSLDPLTPESAGVYRAELKKLARREQIGGIQLADEQGVRAVRVEDLPEPALYAAYFAVRLGGPGAEWDLWVPSASGPPRAVTALREESGELRLQLGIFGGPPPTARPEELDSAGILRSGREWTDVELARLHQAMGLLCAHERATIADATWVRRRAAASPSGAAALYTRSHEIVEIAVYSDLFASDDRGFVGDPRAPTAVSVFGLLHEVGHVLLATPSRRAAAAASTLETELKTEFSEYERLTREAEAEIASFREEPEVRARTEAAIAAVKAHEAVLRAITARRDAAVLRAEAPSPVLAAFAALGEEGPTPYGRTSPEESFAEAFALFKTDPAALSRAMPKAAAWFAAGSHLQ